MDMYCKCGVLDDAKYLFRTIEDRDVVTWNVMVMAFVQTGDFEEACNQFWLMRHEGVSPNEVSFSTALHAAANAAKLEQGSLIHGQMFKAGFGNIADVSSALISMYAKCGSLFDARRAFGEYEDHNVVTWTAMISAFQQHGYGREVLELFHGMLQAGIEPDHTTFVSVLSACGRTGHVDDGFRYFNMMSSVYKIDPGLEHYACMVDLLGRAGRLQDAKKFIKEMRVEPDAFVWGALLAACREHGDLDVAEYAARKLFRIEPQNLGNYVLLYDMYTHRAKSQEADVVRRWMEYNVVKKERGCSSTW